MTAEGQNNLKDREVIVTHPQYGEKGKKKNETD